MRLCVDDSHEMYGEIQKPYRCEACGREFETERALRAHVHAVGLVD